MAIEIFPFLHLAAEIRLAIYALVLPYSQYHQESDWENNDCPVVWNPGKCPSILFASRQTYSEAAEILYRENTFAFYVRHPREPRLPMNESRPDQETFLLISWAKRAWSHPKNPRLPLSSLRRYTNFHKIKQVHLSLPSFNDLLGIDVYMQKSSYAAFNGINAWIARCLQHGGSLDKMEKNRMEYIQRTKEAIDEVGEMVLNLPQIDSLYLSLQARDREIAFAEFMLQGLLNLRNIRTVRAFYVPKKVGGRPDLLVWGDPDYSLLDVLKQRLESSEGTLKDSHLPSDMREMLGLLQSIRARQQRDPSKIPGWLNAMPE